MNHSLIPLFKRMLVRDRCAVSWMMSLHYWMRNAYNMYKLWFPFQKGNDKVVEPFTWFATVHFSMKTPVCHTSRESMENKTPQTTLTLTLWLWPTTFDLDLWPWPWLSWPWPWTIFSETRLKTGIFLHFLPWWPCPLTYDLDLHTCQRYDGP